MYYQHITVMGRATKDAELTKAKSGKEYTKFSIAVNELSRGEEKTEKTSYYDVLVFNASATKAAEIKKGQLVTTHGKPDFEAYINKKGEAKASVTIIADHWKSL